MNFKKYPIFIIIILLIPIICTSCREVSKDDIIEDIKKFNGKLLNYQCETHITHFGFEPAISFKLREIYIAPNILKIETINSDNHNGNTILFRDGNLILKNPGINDEIQIPKAQLEDMMFWKFLLINRLKNLESASNLFNMSIEYVNNKKHIILEVPVKAPEFLMEHERIYLDAKNPYPNRVEMRTKEGNLYVSIEYKEVSLNKKIELNELDL
ncbi:MAG TPA: hypothetical protein GX526_01640 [Thermoanaerobacterales bacterium]|nr:hypothetical protein [Thermoanaerobacterales bacterium]